MRRFLAPAALSAAMLAFVPAISFADDTDRNDVEGIPIVTPDNSDAVFDLGVNISGVPANPAAVKAFIGQLDPETQSAVMGACEAFVKDLASIKSAETFAFCSSAVRG
jgi:hypothetical protein